MDLPLFCIGDVTEEVQKDREKLNKNRLDNYKNNLHLSKIIDFFKKRRLKKSKVQRKNSSEMISLQKLSIIHL
jgi:uncharacterized membrane protein YjjP (DUF1212 family)